jgi:hypothetical protein
MLFPGSAEVHHLRLRDSRSEKETTPQSLLHPGKEKIEDTSIAKQEP